MRLLNRVSLAVTTLGLILMACFGPGRKVNQPELENFFTRADFYYGESQYDSSLHYLDRCLKADRQFAPAHYLLGKIYLHRDGIYNRRLSAEALRKAIEADNKNPEYHYSLGQTLEAQGFYMNALDEYKAAVSSDSSDSRPYIRMAAIYERLGLRYDDEKYFRRALAASQQAAVLTQDPEQYYKQASTFYQLGLYDSSAMTLWRAIPLCDSSDIASQCWLLLGSNLVLMRKLDSASACFESGRSLLDSTAIAEMDDLRYLMTPPEYQDYRTQNPEMSDETVRLFWARLDPDPTTIINERRLEHYARFVHAQITHSLPDRQIAGWKTKRGELYIRYGAPSKMEFSLGDGSGDPPYWTWTYDQFAEPAVFVFEDTFLNGEFDFPFPNKNWNADDYANNPALLANMLGSSAPQTFDYNPGTGPLDYSLQLRQFKGSDGNTELETFIAVPNTELNFAADGEYATAVVRWRESLKRLNYKTAQSFDVSRNFSVWAGQVANPDLSIADRQKMAAIPDTLTFAISLQDSLSGHAGVFTEGIRLRSFYSNEVEISDIVLARKIEQPPGKLNFKRDELEIVSNLDNKYFIGEPVWVYFEIYNLSRGADGKTSYSIRQRISEKRARGMWGTLKGIVGVGDLREVATTYSGASEKSWENRILQIDLSQLREGIYTLSLEIDDNISGAEAVATEEIVIYR